jgi:hypothetical protein
MPNRSHDAAFAEFIADQREVLLGTAFLMFGDLERAEVIVESCLAQLYAGWPATPDPLPYALNGILYPTPGRPIRPWQRADRFELIDGLALPLGQVGIVAELADLEDDLRRVVILDSFVQLPRVWTACVIGADLDRVRALAQRAGAELAGQDPARLADPELAAQLRAAVLSGLGNQLPADGWDDLTHGRILVRRRLLRIALGSLVMLIAAILGASQIPPPIEPPHNEARGPVPGRPIEQPACDLSQPACRASVVHDWRSEMVEVASSHLDPGHTYFSGYYYYDDHYESRDAWQLAGGVLAFDLFRPLEGATEVHIQIATSRKVSLPCGRMTHHSCRVRSDDGNELRVTDSVNVTQGIEAQYSPDGAQVITVAARDTTSGRQLDISPAQLISLVMDPRLRLPEL